MIKNLCFKRSMKNNDVLNDKNIGSLMLGRYEGQAFTIGEDIFIEVVTINHGLVSLRIKAPKTLIINRIEKRKQD